MPVTIFTRPLPLCAISLSRYLSRLISIAIHLIFLQFLQFYKILLSANITKSIFVLLPFTSKFPGLSTTGTFLLFFFRCYIIPRSRHIGALPQRAFRSAQRPASYSGRPSLFPCLLKQGIRYAWKYSFNFLYIPNLHCSFYNFIASCLYGRSIP